MSATDTAARPIRGRYIPLERMSTAAPSNAARSAIPVSRAKAKGTRVLVLYEPGPAGDAALDLARRMDLQEEAAVTVLGVVRNAESGTCTGSAAAFNDAVRDAVVNELEQAHRRLGVAAGRAEYQLLMEGASTSLESWCAARDFDLILLPARRRLLRGVKHPAAERLRRATSAEVQVVPRSQTA